MGTRRRMRWGVGFSALVLVASACAAPATPTGATPSASGPIKGGRLVVAVREEPPNLDPHRLGTVVARFLTENTHDKLIRIDDNGVAQPSLATAWRQDDATTWTFTLRQGVKFHDGTTFNAQAVKFNFDRVLDANNKLPQASALTFLASTEVIDENTVRFKTKQPYGSMLQSIGYQGADIGSPAGFQKFGLDNSGRNPVGTGPWIFKEWVAGDHLTYLANDAYWGGRPYLDELVWKFVTDEQARAAALQAGDVQYVDSINSNAIEAVRAVAGLEVQNVPVLNWTAIVMNEDIKPFADPKVRMAICKAVDREAILAKVMGGIGVLMTSPVPQGVTGKVALAPQCTYDPAAAKALLNEAGGAFATEFWYAVGARRAGQQVAEAVQGYLKAIGVDVKVVGVDSAAFSQARSQGRAPMALSGWGSPAGDPHQALNPHFNSTQIPPNGNNETRYRNTRIDQLLKEGAETADTAKRAAVYDEVQKLLWADVPWVWLDQNVLTTAKSKKLHGQVMAASQSIYFAKAWLDR